MTYSPPTFIVTSAQEYVQALDNAPAYAINLTSLTAKLMSLARLAPIVDMAEAMNMTEIRAIAMVRWNTLLNSHFPKPVARLRSTERDTSCKWRRRVMLCASRRTCKENKQAVGNGLVNTLVQATHAAIMLCRRKVGVGGSKQTLKG